MPLRTSPGIARTANSPPAKQAEIHPLLPSELTLVRLLARATARRLVDAGAGGNVTTKAASTTSSEVTR